MRLPSDPVQRFPFDLSDRFARVQAVDEFGFEQANCALGKRVIIAVCETPHGGIDTGLSLPFGVFDRQILAAPIPVMDQAVRSRWHRLTDCLVQSVSHKAGRH